MLGGGEARIMALCCAMLLGTTERFSSATELNAGAARKKLVCGKVRQTQFDGVLKEGWCAQILNNAMVRIEQF